MNISSNFINILDKNEIFVFGSNNLGHHLGGAAKIAHEKFNAEWGVGHGRTGNCFAIDTMSGVNALEDDITAFIEYAQYNLHIKFLVTEIGCGIAGYKISEVAPLFETCIHSNNIYLPESFYNHIKQNLGA